jgi:hypothetical protein
MLMTHFGSGICSHRWHRRGAIFTDTVPATIMRSAWRGLARKTSEPKRERSYCGAEAAAIISKPQQASAYINGQIERERAQFCAQWSMSARLVSTAGSSC